MKLGWTTSAVDRATAGMLTMTACEQLLAAGRDAAGVESLEDLFDLCEAEKLVWVHARLLEEDGEAREWDAWLLGRQEGQEFVAESGTIFVAGALDQAGVQMTASKWEVWSDEQEARELVEALADPPA